MMQAKSLLCCCSLLTLLLTTPAVQAFGGSSVFQSFSLKIPKFSLVNIEQTQPVFQFAKGESRTELRTRVSVTSNSRQAILRVAAYALPKGISLQIRDTGRVCDAAQVHNATNLLTCLVGVKALWDGELVLTAYRTEQVPDGEYAARLGYSLDN